MTSDVGRPLLTENEARELTAEIYGHLDIAWQKITQAYTGRADIALGYGSWDEYCKAEFVGSRLRLPSDKRKEVVASLTESGLSQRAIASAMGIDKKTVMADQHSNGPNGTDSLPDSRATVPALDGKVRPTKPAKPFVVSGEFVAQTPSGIAPTPPKDMRPKLVQKAEAAVRDLRSAVERIVDTVNDIDYLVVKKDVDQFLAGIPPVLESLVPVNDYLGSD